MGLDHLLGSLPGATVGKERSEEVSKILSIVDERILNIINSVVAEEESDGDDAARDPFYVLDVAAPARLLREEWNRRLENVMPFYAVKCNPDPSFLAAVAAAGGCFDCASRFEISSVLELGVSPSRIVFANTCKPVAHLRYAAAVGVDLATFDSVPEVEKIRRHHPRCRLLLRIKPPNEGGALHPMGPKFGALPEEWSPLLRAAATIGIAVVGVSFHVGSSNMRPEAYDAAIAAAREVFDAAVDLGLPRMRVLDIGGGFSVGEQFERASKVIKWAIGKYFPVMSDFKDRGDGGELTVMAEPGRFLAETAGTLVVNVIGKRVRGETREYWINDGIYGSMMILSSDQLVAWPLTCMGKNYDKSSNVKTYPSNVFGPTCDGRDTVLTGYQLPEISVGEWLVFGKMGAYTTAAKGSNFNGFDTSNMRTYLA